MGTNNHERSLDPGTRFTRFVAEQTEQRPQRRKPTGRESRAQRAQVRTESPGVYIESESLDTATTVAFTCRAKIVSLVERACLQLMARK
jgi:hypothetical protein